MKTTIALRSVILFLIYLIVTNLTYGQIIIEGLPIGDPEVTNDLMTIHGNLTDVNEAFHDTGHMGNYDENASYSYRLDITDIDCCLSSLSGKKPHLNASLSELKFTFKPHIKMPGWANYPTTCASAQGEWDRVYSKVMDHEKLHDAAAKSFFTLDNLKPYFLDFNDRDGECTGLDMYEDSRDAWAETTLADDVIAHLDTVFAHYNEDQAGVDIRSAQGLLSADTTKECP